MTAGLGALQSKPGLGDATAYLSWRSPKTQLQGEFWIWSSNGVVVLPMAKGPTCG